MRMKGIKSVKLGMNKQAKVVMVADVEMGGADDIDSLFLCYFTVMTPPLRLSVLTSDRLLQKLSVLMNVEEANLKQVLSTNPDQYAQFIQQYTDKLISQADEQTKIVLDNDENATQGRALITSILNAGHYLQKTRFHFEDGSVQEQEQEVSIKGMEQTFKVMLEICKDWRNVEVEQ